VSNTKVKWYCKIENQSANHHNMLTAGGQLMDHWPCPRQRGWGKETKPQKTSRVKTQLQSRTAGGLQSRSPEPEDNINLNCHTSLRE
jgi:hypothetical protein